MSDPLSTWLFGVWQSFGPLERAATFYWASLLVYGLSLLVVGSSCSIAFAGVRKRLTDLYHRRAERVERALAGNASPNLLPLKEEYAFSGWVELLPEARLMIGGQEFCAQGEPFEVTTKDPRNLVRAAVSSKGQGVVRISSHGFFYSATWNAGTWNVLPMESQQSHQES